MGGYDFDYRLAGPGGQLNDETLRQLDSISAVGDASMKLAEPMDAWPEDTWFRQDADNPAGADVIWASGSEAGVDRMRAALLSDNALRAELARLGTSPDVVVEHVTVDDEPDDAPEPPPPPF